MGGGSKENGGDAALAEDPSTYSLVVLDLMLPGMDGLTLLAKMRQRDCRARCILLSAFMNNVAALALLMPVDLQAAAKAKRSPALTLMPLFLGMGLGANWNLNAAQNMLPSLMGHVVFGLVILVNLLFLRSPITTLITSVAIPISLVGTLAAMLALGFSINVLTVLGFILAIGLLVDASADLERLASVLAQAVADSPGVRDDPPPEVRTDGVAGRSVVVRVFV